MEVTVDRKEYITIPEGSYMSCSGCAFYSTAPGCREATKDYSCSEDRTIFILKPETAEKEPKYTVQEVLRIYMGENFCDKSLATFKDICETTLNKLQQLTNPEYQEYLKLKQKYEK